MGPASRKGRRLLGVFGFLLSLAACGHVRPVPGNFDPQLYQPVTLAELHAPRPAGLDVGRKVQVTGFFWQYLDYDPRAGANYLTMLRQPLAWSRLRWAALYATPDMRGYYDRLALDREQQARFPLTRLEAVRVFGELAPLGFGTLYLRVHHLERLAEGPGQLGEGATPGSGRKFTEP